MLRNVVAIAQSGEQINQSIGARLVLLANSVFRVRHRDENGALNKECYQHRLRRYQQNWLKQLEQGPLLCSTRCRRRCEWLIKDGERRGVLTSLGVVSPAYSVVGGDCQTPGTLSRGVAVRHRPSLHRENGVPHPCRTVCVKPLPVDYVKRTHSWMNHFRCVLSRW